MVSSWPVARHHPISQHLPSQINFFHPNRLYLLQMGWQPTITWSGALRTVFQLGVQSERFTRESERRDQFCWSRVLPNMPLNVVMNNLYIFSVFNTNLVRSHI
jgi:hypothetical protein